MNFLKQEINKAIEKGLGGLKSHAKMAPLRGSSRQAALEKNLNPKLSAVLILLWLEDNEIYTCLTLRNTYKGTHSAQVSLPGGKIEDTDDSLAQTALRETLEEVGIDNIEIIGQLSDVYIPPSGFLVTPYIGIYDSKPNFQPDPIEVAEIFEVNLRDLVSDKNVKSKKMPLVAKNMLINAPYFDLHGQVVWGATAMILSEFKDLLQNTDIDLH